MNNEPVAWIDLYDLERLPHHDCWVNGQEHKNSVPLYTHPAELTDEEIAEIAMQCSDMDEYGHSQLKEYEFARAILRKAQEK